MNTMVHFCCRCGKRLGMFDSVKTIQCGLGQPSEIAICEECYNKQMLYYQFVSEEIYRIGKKYAPKEDE